MSASGKVPQSPTEFLVGHGLVSLSHSPQLCHLLRVDDAENPLGPVFPPDDVAGQSVAVVAGQQQVAYEFPQMSPAVSVSCIHRRTNDLRSKAAEGGLGWGQNHRVSGDGSSPAGSRGVIPVNVIPVRGSGGRSPQKLKIF